MNNDSHAKKVGGLGKTLMVIMGAAVLLNACGGFLKRSVQKRDADGKRLELGEGKIPVKGITVIHLSEGITDDPAEEMGDENGTSLPETLGVEIMGLAKKRSLRDGIFRRYPDLGKTYLMVYARVMNGSANAHSTGPRGFSLIDSRGMAYLSDSAGPDLKDGFRETELGQGMRAEGWLVFQMESGLEPVTLVYDGYFKTRAEKELTLWAR
ncbi:MAG: hypothetical protein A2Z81_06350 [Omnitrophica WOR_2 bacterium GWA2_45_18]|nr:MAG: hypothetical protein A2Z81_06350 [Omnitrophica WOR_2 bacterium GWA2_45_18]